MELTGQKIWEMLKENLENTLAADPYRQMGGNVKRCLGLKLYVKFEPPAGSRLQHLFVGDEKLDRENSYAVAFGTSQGVPKDWGSGTSVGFNQLILYPGAQHGRTHMHMAKLNADLRAFLKS